METKFERFSLFTLDGFEPPELYNRSAWIEELESGRAEQGSDFLSNKGLECCLGVKCRIDQRPFVAEGSKISYDDNMYGLGVNNPCFKALGDVGFFPCDCYALDVFGEKATHLAGCNDILKLTFAEIAQIIRILWKDPEK